MIMDYVEIRKMLDNMEQKYDSQFKIVFQAIKELLNKEKQVPEERQINYGQVMQKRRIGFVVEDKRKIYGKRGI